MFLRKLYHHPALLAADDMLWLERQVPINGLEGSEGMQARQVDALTSKARTAATLVGKRRSGIWARGF